MPTTAFLRRFLALTLLPLALGFAALGAPFPVPGESGAGDARPVTLSGVAQKSKVAPGDQIAVAIVFDFAPHWHVWPHEPNVPKELDLSPIPTEIALKAAAGAPSGAAPSVPGIPGVRIGAVQWPAPVEVEVSFGAKPGKIESYAGRAVAYLPVMIAPDAAPGVRTLHIGMSYQACNETMCQAPADEVVTVTLEVVAAGSASAGASAEHADLFKDFDLGAFARMATAKADAVQFNVFGYKFKVEGAGALGVLTLCLLAALGGLLLNLTPCVLPVIPIKIMGLAASAGNPAKCFRQGLVMSAGVVAFWLALGAAIATIAGFDAINTLFQRAWFSIAVGGFIAVMAVGMLGMFTVSLPKFVYMVDPSRETAGGAFMFGVMTAVLSTPCTAPFMGTAAAWATKQPSAITMLTFAAIGLGMALPYLVLSANPKLVAKVPRTGPASELVKQVMGMLMLAVACWFLGIGLVAATNTPPDPPSRLYWWAVAAFGAGAGLWLIWRTFKITKKPLRRALFTIVGLGFAIITPAVAADVTDKGPINWTYYTPQRFDEAVRRGDVVVIDFTAEWCLNCKALENAVLHRPEIAALLNGKGVAALKVDLTSNNPDGKAKLKELNWVGIPLLAVYGPGLGAGSTVDGAGQPLKFDTYTQQVVREAIERARKK